MEHGFAFMENIAFTLDLIGKVMIAYTALAVHHRVRKDHKIDKQVFRAMRREQLLGVAGVGCMVFAYLLHVFA